MEVERSAFSLSDVLQTGLRMVAERASRHSIVLGLNVDPAVGVIGADERMVKQIVVNLLSNAVKFTPDGGRIDMTARLAGGTVEVAVRDTGIGIAPEDQKLIFEEFQRAKHGSNPTTEGTGLGLSLARKFVELHGGRIWVESEAGRGSIFTFTLPLARPGQETPEEVLPEEIVGPTVLLVEDDARAIDLLKVY